MELVSDTYHLSVDVLREMAIDVLNWLNWRVEYSNGGSLEVTAQTEQGEVSFELEIVVCGTPSTVQSNSCDTIHCYKASFSQPATVSVGVLFDELHAAALKRNRVGAEDSGE